MSVESSTVKGVFMDGDNASYDRNAKKFLSEKALLARILKYLVTEFRDCPIKDIEEKTEKERREWAEKHQKDVLEAIKRHEESDVDWREFIDKLRKEKEEKDAAKAQDERSAAKVREAAGEEPAKAPEPAKENLLEALQKK